LSGPGGPAPATPRLRGCPAGSPPGGRPAGPTRASVAEPRTGRPAPASRPGTAARRQGPPATAPPPPPNGPVPGKATPGGAGLCNPASWYQYWQSAVLHATPATAAGRPPLRRSRVGPSATALRGTAVPRRRRNAAAPPGKRPRLRPAAPVGGGTGPAARRVCA